nr:MAG TPA: hypothetical protein [Caudoviricetes sp.]
MILLIKIIFSKIGKSKNNYESIIRATLVSVFPIAP